MLTKQELRILGEKEWQTEYKTALNELIKLRLQILGGHSKATDKLKKYRKYVARLLTFKRQQAVKSNN